MAKKTVLALLLSAAVSLGGYFLYRRYRQNQAIANDPANDGKGYIRAAERTWEITKATSIGLGDGFTDTFTLQRGGTFPLLKDSQESWTAKDRQKNKAAIEVLVSKYHVLVDEISNLCSVPRWLIYGIMAVENPMGNPTAQIRADKATGLMMVTPPTANDTIRIAVRKGLLKDEHREILTQKIGSSHTQALIKDKYGVTNHITANDLKDETLNVMVGAAKLSNLIDKYGTQALHKVLACFNQGDYYLQTKGYADYPLAKLYATAGPHRDYLQKTLGKDGSMDIIVNELNMLN
jgi:hypothetical protein